MLKLIAAKPRGSGKVATRAGSSRPFRATSKRLLGPLSCAATLLLAGCASETLFQSNFDQTPVNQPPATIQGVGTAYVDGPPGSVIVIAAPVLPSGKWIRIQRPNGPQVAGLQGRFAQFLGDGVYTCAATMFMPSQSGIATLQFEAFDNQVWDVSSFLHLDFMPDNTVRIDDLDATKFGTFQRDQPFIVQVTLNINAPTSTAHIVLAGAAASGLTDYAVMPVYQSKSRQFGAIRVWQGFPNVGAFDATNIAVTRQRQ
jgi:hypothetical protein